MSATPRASFVIPARNAAGTLACTLDSLLAQGDRAWEALIVDDGSSDDTPRIAAAYAQRDTRFVGLRGSATQGAAAARNVGIERARGQRVAFLDSDDWLAPTFLEKLHAALDAAPGAAAAYCDSRRAMPDGTFGPVRSDPEVARAPFQAFARSCAVAIHAVLMERERLRRAGGFDTTLRTCEDWDLWQRIARAGDPWVHVGEPLAFYRTTGASLSQDVEQVLADAAIVVRRGFNADARVPDADPAHVSGASRAHGASPEQALAYLALWCGALEAARGLPLRERLRRDLAALPPEHTHAEPIAATLLDGVMVGLLTAPAGLAARWHEYADAATSLIGHLGASWSDRHAVRRTQYAFERLVLQYDDLAVPRRLSLTLGLRVQLRALPALALPSGIDRLYVHLCDGARVLGLLELGALGNFAPRDWVESAARSIGWRNALKLAGPSIARGLTPRRLVDATRSARTALRRDPSPRADAWRSRLARAARAALTAAASTAGGDGHASALERIRERTARASSPSLAISAAAPPASPPPGRMAAADDRRSYWEDFFRTADPWHYGSAYEQEKYARQLELLPQRPIGRALELACAEGHFSEQLAARVQTLVATDISAAALTRAHERCGAHANVELRRLDLLADALPEAQDLIVCSEVLYYIDDPQALRRTAQKIAAALAPGGHLITAHAYVLQDDPTRTGFDWDHRWGASTISRLFADVPTLSLEQSIETPLYRIDRFVRRRAGDAPLAARVETRAIEAPMEHEVARWAVWGGAARRRAEVAEERRRRLPVLAYHRVADDGPQALSRYRVGPDAFEAQMSWLRRHGYHAIVSDELAWFVDHRHPFVGRPVMITFDDGYQDFAQVAWPVLRRHDLRAEVFVVSDLVGGRAQWDARHGEPARLMDTATIASMAQQGVRFGSHLATHCAADGLSTDELADELLRSRQALARWTGLAPCALAAPYGVSDARLEQIAAECGYRIGFGSQHGAASLDSQPMRCPRIEVRGDMLLDELAHALEACR